MVSSNYSEYISPSVSAFPTIYIDTSTIYIDTSTPCIITSTTTTATTATATIPSPTSSSTPSPTTYTTIIVMLTISYILILILFVLIFFKWFKKRAKTISRTFTEMRKRNTKSETRVSYDENEMQITAHVNPNYMSNTEGINITRTTELTGTYCSIHNCDDNCNNEIPQIVISLDEETCPNQEIDATAENATSEQDLYSLAAVSNYSEPIGDSTNEKNDVIHDYSSISNNGSDVCPIETEECKPSDYEEFYSVTADACDENNISESEGEEENEEDEEDEDNDINEMAIYGNVGWKHQSTASTSNEVGHNSSVTQVITLPVKRPVPKPRMFRNKDHNKALSGIY